MPFIKESLNDVREPQAAPEDEYDLRIVKAEQRATKKNKNVEMVDVTIVIDNPGVDAMPWHEYLLGWDNDTDDQQVNMRKLTIKRFCRVFDLQEDFEVEDLPGRTGRSFVKQEAGDDGVVRNKAVWPRLDD